VRSFLCRLLLLELKQDVIELVKGIDLLLGWNQLEVFEVVREDLEASGLIQGVQTLLETFQLLELLV
jgi:hypothetical protein